MVDEAHLRGKRVAVHAESYDGIHNALLAGVDTIEHGPTELDPKLLELMRAKGVYLVPTLVYQEQIIRQAAAVRSGPAEIENAKRKIAGRHLVIAEARRLGIPIVVGSDCGRAGGHGVLAAREIALLIEAGLEPGEAIGAATATAAECLGLGEELGTVAPGKLADLIIVDGDPEREPALLQDRARLRHVLQSGTQDRSLLA